MSALNEIKQRNFLRANLLPFGKRTFPNNPHSRIEWAIPEALLSPLQAMSDVGAMFMGDKAVDANRITDAALETAGMSGVTGLLAGPKGPGILGANVWQGGPHKYGPEGASESLKHMGKGEGAQAYGWGRYDAGAESVGQKYKEALSGRELRVGGGVPSETNPEHIASIAIHDYGSKAAAGLRARAKAARYWDGGAGLSAKFDEAADLIESPGTKLPDVTYEATKGHLYKHDLPDEDIARYLDWDAPLSEQPESVRAALANDPRFGEQIDIDGNPTGKEVTGEQIYRTLASEHGGMPQGSEALAKAGIPGLKYYDGMSRTGKEGTRNFVTWDQDVLNRMKLLERNGTPASLLSDDLPGILGK